MTDDLIDITLDIKDRGPLSFNCSLEDPVLRQVCYGYAHRHDAGDVLMYLELDGEERDTVYFTRSSMLSLDSSFELPDHLFSAPEHPGVEEFLHLNIERRWIEWGLKNRAKGVDPDRLFQALHDGGAPYDDIVTLLDYKPSLGPEIRELEEAESIQPYGDTKLKEVFRFDSPFIELYEIPTFLTPGQCREFELLLPVEPEQAGVVEEHLADTSRSGDSHMYPQTKGVSATVRAYQQRISELLKTSLLNMEPLRCQVYSQSMQYRAHVDYLYETEAQESEYLCANGQYRKGQRAWSVVVYLRDGEIGSGTWFSRLKKEFAPPQGTALVWRNVYPSGNPNPYTIHAALPAGEKKKMALTQWVRDNDV